MPLRGRLPVQVALVPCSSRFGANALLRALLWRPEGCHALVEAPLMPVYLVTGKLGSGKSLCSIDRIQDYALRGRRVVANFHCDMAPLSHKADTALARTRLEVIPARPSAADLAALGRGGKGEHDAGLLVLDECATFLNSRTWNGTDRALVIEWLLHSRKLAWDVILICQAASALDKQVREMVCEYLVTCRRMDRINIPIISWLLPIKFPRIHFAVVKYGMGPNDPYAETWAFRGTNLFPCYATEWMSTTDSPGWYTVLPPNLSKHRYKTVRRSLGAFLRACWTPAPIRPKKVTVVSEVLEVRRCAPLLRLPPPVRWAATQHLVTAGIL